MASLGEPKKGGPKTPQSIETKWREEGGFNVTDEDREAWKDFVKAHPHFKPFATSGWEHFQKVDDIVPSQARGRFVYNPAATQSTPAPPPTNSSTPPQRMTTLRRLLSRSPTGLRRTSEILSLPTPTILEVEHLRSLLQPPQSLLLPPLLRQP
ncbi:hypothetical protein R3P38DRAFT_3375122 [Favolaschia claudopus]|uniref:Uncharacterized protein n=1 Tax=Favolaschia claudopus TaxID=2862362 RepID=A0AAV9ZIR1_9AGAR